MNGLDIAGHHGRGCTRCDFPDNLGLLRYWASQCPDRPQIDEECEAHGPRLANGVQVVAATRRYQKTCACRHFATYRFGPMSRM
jgi:hypothetical protein